MKLWILGASAVRDMEVPFAIGYCFAQSGDEAQEKAWLMAHRTYPETKGWGQWRASVGTVTEEDMAKICEERKEAQR